MRLFKDVTPFDARGITTKYESTGGPANGPAMKTMTDGFGAISPGDGTMVT